MNDYGKIVEGVRERNAQKQLMFYDLFIRRVFRSAYTIVGNESEAEEIAQDTMLKVFDRTDLLHDDFPDMERILRRIASNAAIDVVRRRKDFIIAVEEIPDVGDFEASEINDNSLYFSIEEIARILRGTRARFDFTDDMPWLDTYSMRIHRWREYQPPNGESAARKAVIAVPVNITLYIEMVRDFWNSNVSAFEVNDNLYFNGVGDGVGVGIDWGVGTFIQKTRDGGFVAAIVGTARR